MIAQTLAVQIAGFPSAFPPRCRSLSTVVSTPPKAKTSMAPISTVPASGDLCRRPLPRDLASQSLIRAAATRSDQNGRFSFTRLSTARF